ncbi:MAG: ATP-binding protein [Candidatus Methanoperedens sp.]
MSQTKVMIVEDERIVAEDIQRSLENLGYKVLSIVSSGEKAIDEANEKSPDLVLMDIVLKGKMDGIEAAGQIRSRFNIPVVYLSAYSDDNILERAKITDPFGYIIKPFNERELHINIEIALYKHKIEKELKESREWFSTTLKSIGDAVIAADPKNRIIFMNSAAKSLTGWNIMDAIGKSMDEVYDISEPAESPEENMNTGEIELICRDGKKRLIEECRAPNMDEGGNILGSVLVFRDITERRKAEGILQENERLLYMNKIKNEILANMSHELRTPLTSIIGFSQLLKQRINGELSEKQEQYVDNVIASGKFLLDLINDILDFSKIEAQKMELVIESMSVEEAINETLVIMKEQAAKHNITMVKNIEPQLDFIMADKQRFKQVLFNLLSNAVKFSKEDGGTVTISARKSGDMAQFSVSDTGIGIKEEDLGKLFRKFEQLDSGHSRKSKGTGLGLAISKQLVELHGGKITVESKYSEGSTFTFFIPISPKTAETLKMRLEIH